jgi:hypothetical protein
MLSFSFESRGRRYDCTTEGIRGSGLSFSGHWMYQPSVITPSPLTAGQYVLLFNSNLIARQATTAGEAIFLSTSPNGFSSFTAPVPILSNLHDVVDNVCDMADARPVWDGVQWHVYVQASEGDYRTGACVGPGVVFKAIGPSLRELSWVKKFGTNSAKPILYYDGPGIGIGEDMQWFYTAPYGGPESLPIMAIYNNWGFSDPGRMFSYLSADGETVYYWYNVSPAFTAIEAFSNLLVYPDAILAGAADTETLGNPGIGFGSVCRNSDSQYEYAKGIGMFADPVPHPSRVPQDGHAVIGPIESASNDEFGARMFRPRIGRNEHGYIMSDNGTPKTWRSFVYYNDSRVNVKSTDRCGLYSRWYTADQRFSVSRLTIIEE